MDQSPSHILIESLGREGFTFYTGLPCSLLAGPIRLLEADRKAAFMPAVREDTAVAAAAGATLGGGKSVIFMPNSGLGTCVTALWSLCYSYELPVLIIVSLWGSPMRDLPESHGWDTLGLKLLEAQGVPTIALSAGEIGAQVAEAAALMASSRRPVALTVREGVLE